MWTCSGCPALKRFGYEGFNRDRWQHPEEVIDSLLIQPGDRVADLGSGGGYFTFLLAKVVGPSGVVYAVDVDSAMNVYLANRAEKKGYTNIETILAEYHDPLLPDSSLDLIFTSNTYHHLQDRVAYFSNTRKYLRPEGRVAIIDYNGKGWLKKRGSHWTPRDVILKEMSKAGYQFEQEFDVVPRQSFMVFSVLRE